MYLQVLMENNSRGILPIVLIHDWLVEANYYYLISLLVSGV